VAERGLGDATDYPSALTASIRRTMTKMKPPIINAITPSFHVSLCRGPVVARTPVPGPRTALPGSVGATVVEAPGSVCPDVVLPALDVVVTASVVVVDPPVVVVDPPVVVVVPPDVVVVVPSDVVVVPSDDAQVWDRLNCASLPLVSSAVTSRPIVEVPASNVSSVGVYT
jgi:hypothetical protein